MITGTAGEFSYAAVNGAVTVRFAEQYIAKNAESLYNKGWYDYRDVPAFIFDPEVSPRVQP